VVRNVERVAKLQTDYSSNFLTHIHSGFCVRVYSILVMEHEQIQVQLSGCDFVICTTHRYTCSPV